MSRADFDDVDGEPDVVAFRRALRRGAADFLGQRSTEAQYLAGVRRAAVAAGLVDGGKRPTRADRVLRSLAWGSGSIPAGTLPAALEPHLEAFEDGRLSTEALRRAVADALDQVRR